MARKVVLPDLSTMSDPRAKRELNRFVRDVMQALSLLRTTATRGSSPSGASIPASRPQAQITVGIGGNMPVHDHRDGSHGGNSIGVPFSTIFGHGKFNMQDGFGIGTTNDTTKFLNLLKTYITPSVNSRGMSIETLLDQVNGGATFSPHIIATRFNTASGGSPPGEVRGLENRVKIEAGDAPSSSILCGTVSIVESLATLDVAQLIGFRSTMLGTVNFGNIGKYEAFVSDNAIFLATGKAVSEYIHFSAPSPKVLFGNGIVDFYTLRQDVISGTITGKKCGIYINESTATNFFKGKVGIGIGTDPPGAMLEIRTNATTDIGAIIRRIASQTANLTEWQDENGNVLSSVDKDGVFSIATGKTRRLSFGSAVLTQSNGTVMAKQFAGTYPASIEYWPFVDNPVSAPQAVVLECVIPPDYVSGLKVYAVWGPPSTAPIGDVTYTLQAKYKCLNPSTPQLYDVAAETTVTKTFNYNGLTGSGGDVNNPKEVIVGLIGTISTNAAAGRVLRLHVERDTTADTSTLNLNLYGLVLEYTASS